MKKLSLVAIIALCIFGCTNTEKKEVAETFTVHAANTFDEFTEQFVEELWKINPIWASYEGYHAYDAQLPIPGEERDQEKLAFAEEWLTRLSAIDSTVLDGNDMMDYYLIHEYLGSIPFYINEFKSGEWNPSAYNLGGAFFQVLNYRQQELSERLNNISKKLEKVPSYYEAAKNIIQNPTHVHTELAIQQLKGSKKIFEEQILDSANKAHMDEAKMRTLQINVERATNAIDDYVAFLEEWLPSLETEGKSFRIGAELFEKKFKAEIQSEYSAKEIFEIAVEEKSILHDNLYRLSEMLWEKYFPAQEKPGNRLGQIRMVLDEVAQNHVHRDSFVVSIRKQIPALEAFVREKDLLTLDPDKPLIVRETPEYMRGFAGASISAPGPYDKDAETYYNVTPLDHYTDEQAESYLREYNDYTLQILNIHEAIPGHYAQLVYSNQSPSIIKSILGNGAMVEGWAVYTERMMLENEYGAGTPEIGLMYYKWNLRTVCNTILDYGIHVLNFTEEEAMQLLVKEAFQEQSEADGKWRRARLSQVQLCSYFTGYHEIRELRDTLRKTSSDFDLKKFHEEFLSYGSAPVKYIKQRMLSQAEASKMAQ